MSDVYRPKANKNVCVNAVVTCSARAWDEYREKYKSQTHVTSRV